VPDDPPAGHPRPIHLRPSYLGVVWLGGALGTAARYLVGIAMSSHLVRTALAGLGGVPVATFMINISGAFLLGVLLGWLSKAGADQGPRRLLRLLVGTGFLGGFTTYSALATDTVGLLQGGRTGTAIGYALGTLVLGAVASFGGVLIAPGRRHPGSTS
jgi:CrcB protein